MRTGIVSANLPSACIKEIGFGCNECPFVGAGLILFCSALVYLYAFCGNDHPERFVRRRLELIRHIDRGSRFLQTHAGCDEERQRRRDEFAIQTVFLSQKIFRHMKPPFRSREIKKPAWLALLIISPSAVLDSQHTADFLAAFSDLLIAPVLFNLGLSILKAKTSQRFKASEPLRCPSNRTLASPGCSRIPLHAASPISPSRNTVRPLSIRA